MAPHSLRTDASLPAELDTVVERFDHLALAVRDIGSALPMLELLGGVYRSGGHHPTAGFRWVQFDLPGDMKLELLSPLEPADSSHFLVRFLAARGEGAHHVTFKVRRLREAVAAFRGAGFHVVGEDYERQGWKEAFVHPKTTKGLLIQLAEWDDRVPMHVVPLADVLADPA